MKEKIANIIGNEYGFATKRVIEGILFLFQQEKKEVQEKPHATNVTESGVTNPLAYGSTEPSRLEKIKKAFEERFGDEYGVHIPSDEIWEFFEPYLGGNL